MWRVQVGQVGEGMVMQPVEVLVAVRRASKSVEQLRFLAGLYRREANSHVTSKLPAPHFLRLSEKWPWLKVWYKG